MPDMTSTLLPDFVGILITACLYGATGTQLYQYYKNFGSDTLPLKASVVFTFALETVHFSLYSHYLYDYLIKHFGELKHISQFVATSMASLCTGLVIGWSVNLFFVHRIYILSERNLWLCVVISVLATIRPAIAIGSIVIMVKRPTFTAHGRQIIISGILIEALVDGLVAICISYFLLKGRSKVFTSIRNIINTLMRYTLQTGLILMILALFDLWAVVQLPRSAVVGIFHVQAQLYPYCFLTMLNARREFRSAMETSPVILAEREV